MKNTWSIKEIDWLIENYPILGTKECCKILNRTYMSVAQKAHRLKLKINKKTISKIHRELMKERYKNPEWIKKATLMNKRMWRERLKKLEEKEIKRNGYILIRDNKHPNKNGENYVPKHVKIMSEYLKRPLIKGETVHHINMVKSDNRIENLYLFNDSRKHTKSH